MRILYVTASMSVGGVQSLVRDLASQFDLMGHQVGIVSLHGEDVLDTPPGVARFSQRLPGGVSQFRGVRDLRRLIVGFTPDIVHSHAVHSNVLTALALVASQIPLIRTTHSTREGGAVLSAALTLTSLPKSVADTAVSDAVAGTSRCVRSPHVIRNGVDTGRFLFDAASRSDTRRAAGIAEEECVFVTVGRMVAAKDPELLLRAFSLLPQLATRLVWVGDGPERERIEGLVQSLGLSDRVIFVGSTPDVPHWLSAGDVYVSSSAWEGFGLSMVEALASGLPVVATDVGGTREAIGTNEVLVEGRDPALLARAMAGAATKRGLSRESRVDAEVGSRKRMLDEWESFYRSRLR